MPRVKTEKAKQLEMEAPESGLGEGYFGYVAGVLGHTVEARSVIGELQARRQRDYSPALPIAWTYLGLGETASALEWLETALAEREPLGSLIVFPGYDAIRDQDSCA